MRSQSFKLFAMALVLGLASIFAAGSASAQTRLTFETSFDFHVGKEKLTAGKYELVRMNYQKYTLRNRETEESRIVVFDLAAANNAATEPERVMFNRYDEIYFLSGIFERRGAEGKQILESRYEKQIRRGAASRDDLLAGKKAKREKVSVNLK